MKTTHSLAIGSAIVALAIVGGCGLKKGSDSGPSSTFTFRSDPPTSYIQVDRAGMPAVATAVITSKNSYNQAKPSDDASGLFVPQIQTNVGAIHTKLDDDLMAANLTPASTPTSMAQAGPLIVPDTLKITTTTASGFPNGRKLTDPVVDVTLAVVLLNLGANTTGTTPVPQTALTLANIPLNPPANDRPFATAFPYLAAPF
ncbi:MAG: DUF4331 family protein [Planctomycetes bacterium]|nr:DUF4331 family protein [Planctomycetota bacterium]